MWARHSASEVGSSCVHTPILRSAYSNIEVCRSADGGAWRSYRIEASGRSGGALTVKLAGIEDRDQAQALRGAQVCVPRSELPQRDDKDFYRADLIGCEVVNLAGIGLGVVQHFVETPAQALMVVRGEQEYLGTGGAAASCGAWICRRAG